MADASPTSASLRTRRDEYTRRAILVEALRLLAERGPDGVSLRPLAEAVGYSPAALYRYFPNKDSLLDALRAEGWALLAAVSPATLPDDATLEARLAAYRRRIGDFAAAHPALHALMTGPGAPPLGAAAWRAEPGTAALLAWLEGAVAANTIDLDGRSPEEVVMAAWLLAHGTAVLRRSVLAGKGELARLAEGSTRSD